VLRHPVAVVDLEAHKDRPAAHAVQKGAEPVVGLDRPALADVLQDADVDARDGLPGHCLLDRHAPAQMHVVVDDRDGRTREAVHHVGLQPVSLVRGSRLRQRVGVVRQGADLDGPEGHAAARVVALERDRAAGETPPGPVGLARRVVGLHVVHGRPVVDPDANPLADDPHPHAEPLAVRDARGVDVADGVQAAGAFQLAVVARAGVRVVDLDLVAL